MKFSDALSYATITMLIFVVILLAVFVEIPFRTQGFTELYFTDVPDEVTVGSTGIFIFTIVNNEASNRYYEYDIYFEQQRIDSGTVFLAQEESVDIVSEYRTLTRGKQQILIDLPRDSISIHTWVDIV